MSERRQPAPQQEIDWRGVLDAALETPGSVGQVYSRMYNYSFLNQMYLIMQGCPLEPIATYERWKSVSRQVKRGAKAFEIVRPITVKLRDELDEDGNPKQIMKFKPVKSIFPVSMTEGEPLPEIELPTWSRDRALGTLGITLTAFELFDGNTQGYSVGNEIAINPAAAYPEKTFFHEVGHVVLGHTSPAALEEYQKHRGTKEFEAEGTSHLAMNELELMTPEAAQVSRGYLQNWTREEKPTEKSIRAIFGATDKILKAGRELVLDVEKSA